MITEVVDTNVILAANGQHEDLSLQCRAICAERLRALTLRKKLALDDRFEILVEYLAKTKPRESQRPGDAFVKWALRNHAVAARVDLVTLRPHAERVFASFPDDQELANFDRADRKFVAVARSHARRPPILQAADAKWLDWSAALRRHGVTVEFPCPEDIERLHRRKRRSRIAAKEAFPNRTQSNRAKP